jgi:SAM-dependent methyltransferase
MMDLVPRERCPICSGMSKEIGTTPTLNAESSQQVRLLACVDCGHWWHSPVPSQEALLDLYRASSHFVVTPNAKEQFQQYVHEGEFLRYVERFADVAPGVSYLEIGSGGGHTVRELRQRGLAAYGVEPANWSPEEGIVETINDLPSGMRFDIIVLEDVLEHLFDPAAMLASLHEHASADARLFCSVPGSDSWPARRYKTRWNMILPFGHLHYFSKRSARELLERSGWRMENVRRTRTVSLLNLAKRRRVRELAYAILKSGRDQLYMCAHER